MRVAGVIANRGLMRVSTVSLFIPRLRCPKNASISRTWSRVKEDGSGKLRAALKLMAVVSKAIIRGNLSLCILIIRKGWLRLFGKAKLLSAIPMQKIVALQFRITVVSDKVSDEG